MSFITPFFQSFGRLLFGKPPVSRLKKALAELPKTNSLPELRQLLGSYFPSALLGRSPSGENSRNRIFSLETIFWAFTDQALTPGGSCREAVRKIMAWRRFENPRDPVGDMSPDTSAYCTARSRLPLKTIKAVNAHLIQRLQINTPADALWRGRRIKLVDGTGVSMPDTAENQAVYPQHSGQKPGCGFPSMNLAGIFCLSTGALLEVASGDYHAHETKLFKKLWNTLEKGDVLMGDRGFCSYDTFASLLGRGADVLMRLPEIRFRRAIGSKLPNSESFDVVISWEKPDKRPSWMSLEEFQSLPASLSVRVIRYNFSRKGFRSQNATIITTLTDPSITAEELAGLYFRRWEIELHFREIKTILNMDILRCKTPEMIERELHIHIVAYNLIRSLMQSSAGSCGADISRLSFKGCLDTVRHFATAIHAAEGKPRTIKALTDEMLQAVAKDPNPHRPNRNEPRAVKRRPKNHQLLTKPRHETGHLPKRSSYSSKTPKPALS